MDKLLAALGPEVLMSIAKHTGSDEDWWSLLRTSRHFRDALTVPFAERNVMTGRGTAAISAVKHGKTDLVAHLIQRCPALVEKTWVMFGKDISSIARALGAPHLEARVDGGVPYLKCQETSTEFCYIFGSREQGRVHFTLVHIAALYGQVDILKLLLDNKAPPEASSSLLCCYELHSFGYHGKLILGRPSLAHAPRWTAIHYALCKGHQEAASILYHAVKSVHRQLVISDLEHPRFRTGVTLLHHAIKHTHKEIVKLLCTRDLSWVDPNSHSGWHERETPMHYAVRSKEALWMARTLIATRLIRVCSPNYQGVTALEMAWGKGDMDLWVEMAMASRGSVANQYRGIYGSDLEDEDLEFLDDDSEAR